VAGINQQKPQKTRVNRQIRAREVRLIGEDGSQIGVVPFNEALDAAVEAGLDLVEINPTSTPPVCKIMDYGKYRFELSKKERESRSKRKIIEVKEVKMRPKIDTHDYETKKKMAVKFLKAGNKVKVTIMFRGREVVYRKQGLDLLMKLAEEVEDIASVEGRTKSEGKNLSMVLAPKTQAQTAS
jgi:translation initiation factor IF-3